MRPSSIEIKARNLKFTLDESLPRHWFQDDPFMTHFMNALSVTFPRGERQFIDSVKAVRDRVKHPATRADVAGFFAQEALHSREHQGLNEALREMGYPVAELEREFVEMLEGRIAGQDEKSALAVTVAVEHLTALMGRALLGHEDMLALIHPQLRAIWMWHGLEEIEHKAVAFDVYQEVFGDYAARALALFLATAMVFSFTHYAQYKLLEHEGLAGRPSLWAKGLWRLYGPGGLLASSFGGWLDFLRPTFHPWQEDDSALVERLEGQLQTS